VEKFCCSGARWAEHDVGLTKKTRKGDYIKDYAVADFDGDGAHDTVVCTFDDPAEIFIYFQNDKDNWQQRTHTYSNGHEGLDVGDLLRQRKEQQINSPRPKKGIERRLAKIKTQPNT